MTPCWVCSVNIRCEYICAHACLPLRATYGTLVKKWWSNCVWMPKNEERDTTCFFSLHKVNGWVYLFLKSSQHLCAHIFIVWWTHYHVWARPRWWPCFGRRRRSRGQAHGCGAQIIFHFDGNLVLEKSSDGKKIAKRWSPMDLTAKWHFSEYKFDMK